LLFNKTKQKLRSKKFLRSFCFHGFCFFDAVHEYCCIMAKLLMSSHRLMTAALMPGVLPALLLAMLTAMCHAATIPLHLQNAADAPRVNWPVTAGVPLAQGVLQDEKHVRLRDETNRELPLQTRALSRWEDGSIKWLLLDFQANLAPRQSVDYQLETGTASNVKTDSPLKISQNAERIFVDTGALRFAISKKRMGLLASAQIKTQLNGKSVWQDIITENSDDVFASLEHNPPGEPQEENWLRDAKGGARDVYRAALDTKFSAHVEESGPLRATIRLDAWHQNAAGEKFAPLTLRLSTFAGSDKLKVLHTFVFSGNPKTDFIRSMGWSLPLAGNTFRATFGAQNAPQNLVVPRDGFLNLTAIGPDKFYHNIPVTADRRVEWTLTQASAQAGSTPAAKATGHDAPGWIAARGEKGGVALALRDFRHQAPKEIRLNGDGKLTLYFWPESGEKVLDFRRRYDYIDNEVHYDLSLWEYGGLGVGKTHEFWLQPGGDAKAAEQLSRNIDEPLYAMPAPRAVSASQVFGKIAPRDPQKFPRLEAWQDFGLAWIRANQKAFRWDGLIDYGDNLYIGYGVDTHRTKVLPNAWGSRGYVGWQNEDGGLCHALFLAALRSADREVMKQAELLTRHVMDVDVCHYCPPEPRHVGGGHRHDQQHWGNGVRGYGTGTHGVIDFYLLFGDRRAYDVALETANFHLDPTGEDEDMIGGLWRAWEISGKEKYRDGALEALQTELSPQATSGPEKWPFTTGRHFRFVSNTSTNLALYRAARADSEHEKLDATIVAAMRGVAPTLLSSWRDHGYLPTLLSAEAYNISGDPLFLETGKSLVRDLKIPADLSAQKYWPQGLDALSFEEMTQLSQKLNINNIYTLTMFGLVALPYAQDTFERAGVSEIDLDKFQPIADAPTPFEETLVNAKINTELGLAFIYQLTNGSQSDKGGKSTLRLFENDKELLPAHAPHAQIREKGGGHWSHWGSNTIYFSTSDNSDPRTNGRTYRVVQE
jgi:hypothetical protein